MQTETTKLSENGRIVIPAGVRKALGYQSGEILTLRVEEDGLHVQSLKQALTRAQAVVMELAEPERSLSEELIAERRLEAGREPNP